LSTLELHQELEQMLTDNPLLERLDDPLDRSVRLLATAPSASAPTGPRDAADSPASDAAAGGRRRRQLRRPAPVAAKAASSDADATGATTAAPRRRRTTTTPGRSWKP
jgi:RNA polymerase sigma-54 factor